MADLSRETQLIALGRSHAPGRHFVNPPIQRGSTVLFSTVAEIENHQECGYTNFRYGRYGTPTNRAFEDAMCTLEGGYRTLTTPSGLAAITTVLTTFGSNGAHVLIPENVYRPTRNFCQHTLGRLGVEVEYYDPTIGAGMAGLLRPNTTLLYMESPGTGTFEMTDVPLFCQMARRQGIATAVDNTWGTPLLFRPLEHGADISIHSCTKYIMGHADGMMGCLTMTEAVTSQVQETMDASGMLCSPEEAYLGLRGLRTLGARLKQHQASALAIAEWLQARPEVDHVRYPALPGAPGHDIWKRDYSGACGLFSMVLKPVARDKAVAMMESLKLFGMGFSWGGFESLAVPDFGTHHDRVKLAWPANGPVIRLHIGLEAVDDLIADLDQGFRHLT